MRLKPLLLLLLILNALSGTGQTYHVKGSVNDVDDSSKVSGATVLLTLAGDSALWRSLVSGNSGNFVFDNIPQGEYNLLISYIGYENIEKRLSVKSGSIDLGQLYLFKNTGMLEEVIVEIATPPLKQKGDTLEYNAGSFKMNPDANADDMIKKMPGIVIEQGTVKAGGEDVRKVTVDGRDFFGEDAMAALKNMPAEVIDKIQVFDRLSDQAAFTGFDDGNTTKAINIVTKADMRNGQFGRVYAGYGSDNRYTGGGNVSLFKGTRRISLVGLVNNINQQNFSSEDLLGVTGSGGGGRGRGRGGRGGGDFLVGQQGGISKTKAFGINFSDLLGKKTEVSGSYFYNNSNNTSDERVNREDFIRGDSSEFYDENNLSSSRNTNHRLSLRIEHKFDSANTLMIMPAISFQDNSSFSDVTGIKSFKTAGLISRSVRTNDRNSNGYNINNNILFRHAFPKRGRTVSVNLYTSLNSRDGITYRESTNRFYDDGNIDSLELQFSDQSGKGYRISPNIAYTEPIGSKGQLQINYQPSWSKNNSDQQTFNYDEIMDKYSRFDSILSNVYNNTYNTQNGGVSYRIGNRDNMLSAGVSYQYAVLAGEQQFPEITSVNRRFSNILPNLMWRKKISEKSSIRLMYRSGTDEPSVNQLQEVINNNNPLFLRTGNPDLQQEYTHRVMARYTFTNSAKGQSFLANVYLQQTNDYIGNATFSPSADSLISRTVVLKRGSQLSKPVNMDGYWSVRSFFTFGMPLKFLKSNLNWNAGYSYSITPGLIDNVENISNNQNYNIGAVLGSNVSEYVDFTLSYSASFNKVKNSIQPDMNNNYFSQSAGAELTLLSKSGWYVQNSLNNRSNRGLSDGFNQNYWLWNMGAGKKFLKNQKADLRITVFDLLKQNRSINRNVTGNYIEDVQTEVLQQYFMLTFSYRLRNFGKVPERRGGMERGGPGGREPGRRPGSRFP